MQIWCTCCLFIDVTTYNRILWKQSYGWGFPTAHISLTLDASLMATCGHPNYMDMLSLSDPNPPLVVTNDCNSQLQELAHCQSPSQAANFRKPSYKVSHVVLWLLAPYQKKLAGCQQYPTRPYPVSIPPRPPPDRKRWTKKTYFVIFMTLTFDLEILKISNFPSRSMYMPKIKVVGPTVRAAG